MHSESGVWLRAIFDTVTQPLWVIGPDGVVVTVNDAASRLLGHRRSAPLIGQSSHKALHHAHPDGSPYAADTCPIVHATRASGKHTGHDVFLTRAGTPVPVRWSVAALPLARHHLLAFNPSRAASSAATLDHRALVSRLRLQVQDRFRDPDFSPEHLARANRISLRTLQNALGREQQSPAALIRSHRLNHAVDLLREGASVKAAAYESGFRDVDTFARAFRREFGVAPSRYVAP